MVLHHGAEMHLRISHGKLYEENQFALSAFSYLISYMFDCWDGYYARKYNMESKFGDYYDHVSDMFIGI